MSSLGPSPTLTLTLTLQVVRLRCDTKAYFNWRDRYIGAMNVRAHRRDLDAADSYLWFRSWTDRLIERIQNAVARARSRLPTKKAARNSQPPPPGTPHIERDTPRIQISSADELGTPRVALSSLPESPPPPPPP